MPGKPIATEGTYDGKPTLALNWRPDSTYKPFSFGVSKARLILALVAEIQAFVDRHPDQATGARRGTRPSQDRTTSDERPDQGKAPY